MTNESKIPWAASSIAVCSIGKSLLDNRLLIKLSLEVCKEDQFKYFERRFPSVYCLVQIKKFTITCRTNKRSVNYASILKVGPSLNFCIFYKIGG